ncbi:MAG: septum formation initiator family protein [Patescibacteria group bacterium]|jgi:cell division protein FtsB
MIKNKIRPRNFNGGPDSISHSFFYRLVSNQRFLAIIGLVFLVVIIFPLAQTYSQRRLAEKEVQDVKNKISNYEIQNKQLEDLITYLKSDQSLEAQARLNLNMKKPGEAVIVVEDKKVSTMNIAASSTDESRSNLVKWWRYFFN